MSRYTIKVVYGPPGQAGTFEDFWADTEAQAKVDASQFWGVPVSALEVVAELHPAEVA